MAVVNRMLAEASDTADVQKWQSSGRLCAQPCGVLSHSFPFVLSTVLRQFTSLDQRCRLSAAFYSGGIGGQKVNCSSVP